MIAAPYRDRPLKANFPRRATQVTAPRAESNVRDDGRPREGAATSSEIDIFACDNGKSVVINKHTEPQALTIDLGGKTSGTYEVWASQQNNPTGAIEHVVRGAAYAGSVISYTVPAGTAASIDVT